MRMSDSELTKFQTSLQQQVGPLVLVTFHFIKRLAERTLDLEEFALTFKSARDILKDRMCVIAYQSVVNNGVTRVTITSRAKMVCFTDETRMKLILRTIY